jgi:hypothetical protein
VGGGAFLSVASIPKSMVNDERAPNILDERIGTKLLLSYGERNETNLERKKSSPYSHQKSVWTFSHSQAASPSPGIPKLQTCVPAVRELSANGLSLSLPQRHISQTTHDQREFRRGVVELDRGGV